MFLKTTKDKRHYHITYQKPSGEMVMAQANDHTHPIVNGKIGAYEGHTHKIEGEMGGASLKQDKKKDNDIVSEVISLYKAGKELEKDFRKKAIESEEFYMGKQWKAEDRRALESKKRACLTINEIAPKIDLLSGYQRQNRYDIKFFPVEEGDGRVADILTNVVKNITEQNNFDYAETKVFEDGTITGRGLLHVYVNYDKNIHGDIVIERFPWDECVLGPHNKEDLSDCEYLVKWKWFSGDNIKGMWPEKAKDIQSDVDRFEDLSDPHENYKGEQYAKSDNTAEGTLDPELVNLAKKEFKVLELWRKVYDRVVVLANPTDDFYHNAGGWGAADIAAVKTLDGFSAIPRLVTKFRVVTVAGDTLLEDKYSDMFDETFSIIPFYAKKRGENAWGKVEDAKDPQREVNKRHSQAIDVLNRAAAYGWFWDANTFPTPKARGDFEANSSTPGFNQEVSNTGHLPEKVEGAKFPIEIVQLEELSSAKLKEIMGINSELLGMQGRAESGVAIMEKKRQGLIGNEFLFDNLALTKRLLGRILIKLIQKIYTPERILRILENRNAKTPVEIAGQPMMPAMQEGADPMVQMAQVEQRRQEILGLLQEADLGKYDVAVGESAYNPTVRSANFIIWMDAASKGIPIPPEVLVDLSDLPDKDKVKQGIQDMLARQQATEDKKMQMELGKTAMAKGIPMDAAMGMGGGEQ